MADLRVERARAGGALARLGPVTHAILRIGVGLLFMGHGAQKLFGWFGGFGGRPGATAELMTQMGLAGVLEFFGGLLIVLGLLTRPVALGQAGLGWDYRPSVNGRLPQFVDLGSEGQA